MATSCQFISISCQCWRYKALRSASFRSPGQRPAATKSKAKLQSCKQGQSFAAQSCKPEGQSSTRLQARGTKFCSTKLQVTGAKLCSTRLQARGTKFCSTKLQVTGAKLCSTKLQARGTKSCGTKLQARGTKFCSTKVASHRGKALQRKVAAPPKLQFIMYKYVLYIYIILIPIPIDIDYYRYRYRCGTNNTTVGEPKNSSLFPAHRNSQGSWLVWCVTPKYLSKLYYVLNCFHQNPTKKTNHIPCGGHWLDTCFSPKKRLPSGSNRQHAATQKKSQRAEQAMVWQPDSRKYHPEPWKAS